jgi:microcystin-dependent protein
MGVLTTGQTFSSGDQVTAAKLNDIANQATFTSASATTDDSTLTLGSSKLKVKDLGITSTQLATDSVITAKIQDGAVTSAKLDAGAVSVLMPSGSLMPYAGSSAPTGYLLCDGAAISRTTYSALFGLVGTTYGSGDGSSTFNIPDLRGRVIAGQDDMGGVSANRLTGLSGGVDGDVLGGTGGAETHGLSQAEMPAHRHLAVHGPITSPVPYYHSSPGPNTTLAGNFGGGTPDDSVHESYTKVTGGTAGESGSNSSTSSYSTTAHNNVQPTIILNYIIKT